MSKHKIMVFKYLNYILNICHICKRFGHSKDWTQIFPESFECFKYPASFTIFAKDSDIRQIQLCKSQEYVNICKSLANLL